jgi:1,2-diacylglycerol 3-alpha-glucosyltransferase
MKILQLTCHYSPNIGGVETHLDDLVGALVQKKHDVFVLTYKPLTAKVDAKLWEKKNNFKIFRIPWISGFFYKFVDNPIAEFLYLFPGLFLTVPFVISIFRPNVIHTHGLVAGFVGVFWGKIFGIQTITTTHSVYLFPKSGFYRIFSKWLFDNSSAVLTLSKQSKKEIEDLGVDENKIKVFTYWIDLKRFSRVTDAKKKVGWQKKFVVLFVGRLIEQKGILVLLESLKSWNKNITLAIVGTGPLEEGVLKFAAKNKNLLFLSKIDNDKLPLYYSACDLLIVPSTSEEGFGRVIIESLACGTPVIGANRGAIPEAMDDTVGKIIDISPENITNEVQNFYKNPALISKMSRKSVLYARRRYGLTNLNLIMESYQ